MMTSAAAPALPTAARKSAALASGTAQTTGTTATSGSSDSSSDSSSSSASISANDFLTLLVSEMKNQDPTADTDPNEYIDQLVQVNSLQQLIQINQDLTPTSSTPAGSSSSGSVVGAVTSALKASSATAPSTTHSPIAVEAGQSGQTASTVAGTLSPPPANPRAERVATALTRPPSPAESHDFVAAHRGAASHPSTPFQP